MQPKTCSTQARIAALTELHSLLLRYEGDYASPFHANDFQTHQSSADLQSIVLSRRSQTRHSYLDFPDKGALEASDSHEC